MMNDYTGELRELNAEDLDLVSGGDGFSIMEIGGLPPGTSLSFVNNNYASNMGNQGLVFGVIG